MNCAIEEKQLEGFEERLRSLGYSLESGISIFPRNFETAMNSDELVFDDLSMTVKKVWKRAGIEEKGLIVSTPQYLQERDDLPQLCVFVCGTMLTPDLATLKLALELVKEQLINSVKGFLPKDKQNCKLKVVNRYKKGKEFKYRELNYEGPPEQIFDLMSVLKNEP